MKHNEAVGYLQLRRYIAGWMNYFGLSEFYRPVPELDLWIRRRIRMCYLKKEILGACPRDRLMLFKLGPLAAEFFIVQCKLLFENSSWATALNVLAVWWLFIAVFFKMS